jgi:DNA-binding response OmpR family regulator
MSAPTVLIVEDNPNDVRLIRDELAQYGYHVTTIATGDAVEEAMDRMRPDVIVLDLMLPGVVDGFEVCERLRARSLVPIIVVTAMAGHREHLKSLRLGADHVLIKPFDPEELYLRLEGVRRRAEGRAPAAAPPYEYRGLCVDFVTHRTTLHGEELALSEVEQRLLEELARSAGRICLSEDLLERVLGEHAVARPGMLHVHISRLRRKLGDDARQPRYLLTHARVGYSRPQPTRASRAS